MARRHRRMVGEPQSAEEWDQLVESQFLVAALEHQFRADLRRGGRRKVRLLTCAVARAGSDVLPAETADLIAPLEEVADGRRPALAITRLDAAAQQRSEAAAEVRDDWQRANTGQRHPPDLVRPDIQTRSVTCLTPSRPNLHHPGLLSTCVSGLRSLAAGVYGTVDVRPHQARADREYARLVRCIFGNPFRPVTLDPSWRTSTVVALAQGIYDDRAFDRMPILADALQDAGCDNEDVLSHCRDAGPHARGCWVVDLVLGKV